MRIQNGVIASVNCLAVVSWKPMCRTHGSPHPSRSCSARACSQWCQQPLKGQRSRLTDDGATNSRGLSCPRGGLSCPRGGLSCPRARGLSCPRAEGLSCTRARGLSYPRAGGLSCPRARGLSCPRAGRLSCPRAEGLSCTRTEFPRLPVPASVSPVCVCSIHLSRYLGRGW